MENMIYVLGIGNNTPVLIDLATACGYKIAGLYHYKEGRTGETEHGYKIIGSFDDMFKSGVRNRNFLLTMGDSKIRTEMADKIIERGGGVPTLIHPNANVSQFACISDICVYVFAFADIQADTKIGRCTYIAPHVQICHMCHIGESCFIAAAAVIGSYTHVDDFVFVGQGAISISGKVNTIGKNAIIAAGALLTKDVPASAMMVGSPAKSSILFSKL